MASESDAFSEFLATYLENETGVEAWEDVVLGDYPSISYRLMRSSDLMVVGARRVWAEGVWQVVAETQGEGTRRAAEIASAIDEAMHGMVYANIAQGVQVVDVIRTGEFRRSVIEGDEQRVIRRRGGEYRVRVRQTN